MFKTNFYCLYNLKSNYNYKGTSYHFIHKYGNFIMFRALVKYIGYGV